MASDPMMLHAPNAYFKKINLWLPLMALILMTAAWFVPRTHSGMVYPHENVGGDATATVALNTEYWHANGIPVPLPQGGVSAHL